MTLLNPPYFIQAPIQQVPFKRVDTLTEINCLINLGLIIWGLIFYYLSSRYYTVPNFNESICLNFSVESKFSKSRFEVFFFSWTDVSIASNSSEQHTLLLQLQKSRTTCFRFCYPDFCYPDFGYSRSNWIIL